jgi:hypothetical protein
MPTGARATRQLARTIAQRMRKRDLHAVEQS